MKIIGFLADTILWFSMTYSSVTIAFDVGIKLTNTQWKNDKKIRSLETEAFYELIFVPHSKVSA